MNKMACYKLIQLLKQCTISKIAGLKFKKIKMLLKRLAVPLNFPTCLVFSKNHLAQKKIDDSHLYVIFLMPSVQSA